MAPDLVAFFGRADLDQGRVGSFADIHDLRTAWVEPATVGRV